MNWIWISVRVAGLTAYLLLTLSVLAGILRHIPKKKSNILEFHQVIGQIGLLFIAIHAYLLVYDHYQPYSLVSVLVPFMSPHERILTGIGTITMYLLIVVILTSDFMKLIGRKVWKKTHYLVFPMWFLSFMHSFFIGTDTGSSWAQSLYWCTFLLVLGATVFLVAKVTKKPKKQIKRKIIES